MTLCFQLMIYGLKCAALWNCITKECWLGHFKEEINNQRISDSPRQRKTERVKDKSADARPRQDCWVRQIVSLIAVCWDCNRDELNIWFRKWDVHVFASSYLISFYHFIIPKLSRGKLQHTLSWLLNLEIRRIQWMSVYLCHMPLYMFCISQYLIKQIVIKLENSISSLFTCFIWGLV